MMIVLLIIPTPSRAIVSPSGANGRQLPSWQVPTNLTACDGFFSNFFGNLTGYCSAQQDAINQTILRTGSAPANSNSGGGFISGANAAPSPTTPRIAFPVTRTLNVVKSPSTASATNLNEEYITLANDNPVKFQSMVVDSCNANYDKACNSTELRAYYAENRDAIIAPAPATSPAFTISMSELQNDAKSVCADPAYRYPDESQAVCQQVYITDYLDANKGVLSTAPAAPPADSVSVQVPSYYWDSSSGKIWKDNTVIGNTDTVPVYDQAEAQKIINVLSRGSGYTYTLPATAPRTIVPGPAIDGDTAYYSIGDMRLMYNACDGDRNPDTCKANLRNQFSFDPTSCQPGDFKCIAEQTTMQENADAEAYPSEASTRAAETQALLERAWNMPPESSRPCETWMGGDGCATEADAVQAFRESCDSQNQTSFLFFFSRVDTAASASCVQDLQRQAGFSQPPAPVSEQGIQAVQPTLLGSSYPNPLDGDNLNTQQTSSGSGTGVTDILSNFWGAIKSIGQSPEQSTSAQPVTIDPNREYPDGTLNGIPLDFGVGDDQSSESIEADVQAHLQSVSEQQAAEVPAGETDQTDESGGPFPGAADPLESNWWWSPNVINAYPSGYVPGYSEQE
ncbi:MAG: hypothetical protein Q7S01_06570 [bacterium]|nr:hypothetical protein [bacterium]